MRNRSTVFTLGNRLATIENEMDNSIIIPHASQKSEQKVNYFSFSNSFLFIVKIIIFQYSLESIFRSEQFALLDNASNESLFLADFFMARDKNGLELFMLVFGKTFDLFTVSIKFKLIHFGSENLKYCRFNRKRLNQ